MAALLEIVQVAVVLLAAVAAVAAAAVVWRDDHAWRERSRRGGPPG